MTLHLDNIQGRVGHQTEKHWGHATKFNPQTDDPFWPYSPATDWMTFFLKPTLFIVRIALRYAHIKTFIKRVSFGIVPDALVLHHTTARSVNILESNRIKRESRNDWGWDNSLQVLIRPTLRCFYRMGLFEFIWINVFKCVIEFLSATRRISHTYFPNRNHLSDKHDTKWIREKEMSADQNGRFRRFDKV